MTATKNCNSFYYPYFILMRSVRAKVALSVPYQQIETVAVSNAEFGFKKED